MRIVRHRVLALLASLKMVELADRAGLPSVLVLEGDVRPVTRHALTLHEVEELRAFLTSHPWQIVRPSGYFWDFAPNRGKGAARGFCPAQCKCASGVGLSRACLVKRAATHGTHHAARVPPCDVRDTVGFAVHRRTFPAFRKLRRAALDALAEMAASVEAKVVASGGTPAVASNAAGATSDDPPPRPAANSPAARIDLSDDPVHVPAPVADAPVIVSVSHPLLAPAR